MFSELIQQLKKIYESPDNTVNIETPLGNCSYKKFCVTVYNKAQKSFHNINDMSPDEDYDIVIMYNQVNGDKAGVSAADYKNHHTEGKNLIIEFKNGRKIKLRTK